MIKFWQKLGNFFFELTKKCYAKFIKAVATRLSKNEKTIAALEAQRIGLENENLTLQEILDRNTDNAVL